MGEQPEGLWQWGDCGIVVYGYSHLSIAAFKLADVLIAAAHIVQTCFVDRGLNLGGAMRLPDDPDFCVSVAKSELSEQNLTAVQRGWMLDLHAGA